MPACVYVYHVHAVTIEVWKKALDPLELELYMIVNNHVSSTNSTHVLWKSGQYF